MKLNPYIMFYGNTEEAFNFYKDCFRGEITHMGRYRDSPMEASEELKDKILHATLVFDDNVIMASDHIKPETPVEGNIQLNIDVPAASELEQVFIKMAEGGTITMPLQDMYWGARFGMITDKFGIKWMFSHEIKK